MTGSKPSRETPLPGGVDIDGERLWYELETLSSFSSTTPPAITRVMLSPQDLEARAFVTGLFEEARLSVRSDAAGNLFARWAGREPSLPAISSGSHIDAIPHSGRFDGTIGVLGALEAVRALQRSGFEPERSIEIVMFTSEEPTRYGIGCLGSRLMSGALDPDAADQLEDADGVRFADLRSQVGYGGDLASVRLEGDALDAFIELHIEQGPLLERAERDIGVVSAIAAPAALSVRYGGPGGHAGAVLMKDRRDALLGAARLVDATDHCAREVGNDDTVATVGQLDVHPNAINSIPSDVTMGIDVRDVDEERRDRVLGAIMDAGKRIGAKLALETHFELLNQDAPATCDPTLRSHVRETAASLGATTLELPSRAYHDALFMSRLAPTVMIFIPCRDGVSHRPEEWVEPRHLATGCAVLAGTLARASTTRQNETRACACRRDRQR